MTSRFAVFVGVRVCVRTCAYVCFFVQTMVNPQIGLAAYLFTCVDFEAVADEASARALQDMANSKIAERQSRKNGSDDDDGDAEGGR